MMRDFRIPGDRKDLPPFGGQIGGPLGGPPPKQVKTLAICPSGCDPPLVFWAIPDPKVYDTTKRNGFARCLRCLTYWEATIDGEIVNIKPGLDVPKLETPKGEKKKEKM